MAFGRRVELRAERFDLLLCGEWEEEGLWRMTLVGVWKRNLQALLARQEAKRVEVRSRREG